MLLSFLVLCASTPLVLGTNGISIRGINLPDEAPKVEDGNISATDELVSWRHPRCWFKLKKGLPNGCSCKSDLRCQSGRCASSDSIVGKLVWRCADKLDFGDTCTRTSATNDCKDGLSCGGPLSVEVGKCYHDPRKIGEPCHVEAWPLVSNNCANDAYCMPTLDGTFKCMGGNDCSVTGMKATLNSIQSSFDHLKSIVQKETRKFLNEQHVESFIADAKLEILPALEALKDVESIFSEVNDLIRSISACADELLQEVAGGLIVSIGVEADAGAVIGGSLQFGMAISPFGDTRDPVKFFWTVCYPSLKLGEEMSIGAFLSVQFGGGFNSKVGSSVDWIGTDISPEGAGLDVGAAFGYTTDGGYKPTANTVFEATVNLSVGEGEAVEAFGKCTTYFL